MNKYETALCQTVWSVCWHDANVPGSYSLFSSTWLRREQFFQQRVRTQTRVTGRQSNYDVINVCKLLGRGPKTLRLFNDLQLLLCNAIKYNSSCSKSCLWEDRWSVQFLMRPNWRTNLSITRQHQCDNSRWVESLQTINRLYAVTFRLMTGTTICLLML